MRQHSSPARITLSTTPKWCRCWSARTTTSIWKSTITRCPYALQGKRLEAHLAEHTVTLYHAGKVVAQHIHAVIAKASTAACVNTCQRIIQALLEWSPKRLLGWAASIGPLYHALGG